MRQIIDGTSFRRMVISAAAAIEINKDQINDLNVFPVPDGDTGTNMSMTLNNAVNDLKKIENPTLTKAADVTASALLRGARGNSGVILSLLFRGMAKSLKGEEVCGGTRLANALLEGVDAAYKAVMKPAEGTILTVSRIAAAGAENAAAVNNYAEFVLEQTLQAAEVALSETVEQNPVLKKAGVVDAGGMGWVIILRAMLASLRGDDTVAPEKSANEPKEKADFSEIRSEDITFGYCTEFIVSRDNDNDSEALRAFLSTMGDSLVLVEDDEIIKVHVHTNHPGTVIEKALTYGSLISVKIENMRLQHTEKVLSEEEKAPAVAPPEKKFGMVAVCAGSGIVEVLESLGVDSIVPGGQTMNPCTQDILAQINKTPAEVVFVFPNNKNIIMAAEQAIPLSEKKVIVVPSKTVPQGISAMLVFDPEASEDDNLASMMEAMQNVDTMQITYAARNSDFDGYEIHEGDFLALYEGSLFGTGKDLNTLLKGLAQKLKVAQKEFVTIFYGEGVDEKKAKKAQSIFEKYCPDAEITLLCGNQPVYYYLISAE